MAERRGSARRIRTVARREFVTTVTRLGYVATLVGMPLLLLLTALLPALAVALSGGEEALLGLSDPDEKSVIGVLDGSGDGVVDDRFVDWHNGDQEKAWSERRMREPHGPPLALPLPDFMAKRSARPERDRGGFEPDARIELRRYEDLGTAREDVRAGRAAAVWVLPEGYPEREFATVLVPEGKMLAAPIQPGQLAVARLLRRSMAAPFIADEARLARLVHVLDPRPEIVPKNEGLPPDDWARAGLDETLRFMLPLLASTFFAMLVFVASGYLLDGVGEEKENRVLEVLLSSVTPEELLLGKMLGLGAAGLLQTISFGLIGLGPLVVLGLSRMPGWGLLGMMGSSVLGFAEYASLMAASGAIAGNRHEGRQVSVVWTLIAMLPVFVLPMFLGRPDAPLPLALSLFPLTAPVALTLRLGLGTVPLWQAGLSMALMAGMAWLAWRLGSRVFRVGILMTGARPPLRQVWGWMRQG